MWKNEDFSLTEIFFREINSLVISLVKIKELLGKNVTLTKFLLKKRERGFPQFHEIIFN